MGKKSKKNGAPKGKASSLASATSSSSSESLVSGGTGGILLSGSGGTGGGKKQRCVGCLALLKDLSKAHQCPGCSLLFCWRCEKKIFVLCPNKDRCVRPMKRCLICAEGGTMAKELVAAGILPTEPPEFGQTEQHPVLSKYCKYSWDVIWSCCDRSVFQRIANEREGLSEDCIPAVGCLGDKCPNHESTGKLALTIECVHCAEHQGKLMRLHSCLRCGKFRCNACVQAAGLATVDDALEASNTERDGGFIHLLSSLNPDGFIYCRTCSSWSCYSCMDVTERRLLGGGLLSAVSARAESDLVGNWFQCGRCYWSAKPCTNPTCPNVVGVPTKRCGGCHLDRYCSVECQAAAYPGHKGRCKKIQEKRAAAGIVKDLD